MVITEHAPGELRVHYDGGTPAQRAWVVLYDSGRNVLVAGGADHLGVFRFDAKLQPAAAVADDGLGHRAELVFGRISRGDLVPLWIKLFFALSLFSAVGAVSYYYHR